MQRLWQRFWGLDKNFRLFLIATLMTGFGIAVDSSVFNNYLKDVYHLDIAQRTFLEFPREIPGLLVYFFLAALMGLGDLKVAAVANLAVSVGMLLLGVIPPIYMLMLFAVFIYSSGQHLYMPLANSIGMSFASDANVGRKLGKIGAVNTLALVVGSLTLMALFQFAHITYSIALGIGSGCFFIASLALFQMKPSHADKPRTKRWLWKKEYHLFYGLSVLYGARKQIFLTFAPWVLVDIFKMPVTYMAFLVFTIYTLGIFVRPWIGSLIDKKGERFVLGAEALLLVIVCLLYGLAPSIFPAPLALVVISLCFIIDQSSSNVGMARATYLRKIALKPEDIAPTLSLGISLDHITSIAMPLIGGAIWIFAGKNGYQWVFFAGALIAGFNWFMTRKIRLPELIEA